MWRVLGNGRGGGLGRRRKMWGEWEEESLGNKSQVEENNNKNFILNVNL